MAVSALFSCRSNRDTLCTACQVVVFMSDNAHWTSGNPACPVTVHKTHEHTLVLEHSHF